MEINRKRPSQDAASSDNGERAGRSLIAVSSTAEQTRSSISLSLKPENIKTSDLTFRESIALSNTKKITAQSGKVNQALEGVNTKAPDAVIKQKEEEGLCLSFDPVKHGEPVNP